MTPAEYAALVDEVVAAYPAETAARLIEARCHPPYRRPRREVLFPPPAAGDGAGESAGSATGPGGAA